MKSIKTLALAAVFAAGASAFGLAEDAAPDLLHDPIFGAGRLAVPPASALQTEAPKSYEVPASQWIADRFSPDRMATLEEGWFRRAEAGNTGSDGGGGE